MKRKKNPVYLPLTHALAYIIGSTLLFSGGSYAVTKNYLKNKQKNAYDPKFAISTIIQTGPQKEALKTEYLAELLGASADHPYHSKRFNKDLAKQRLLKSPLISKAEVKVANQSTLYIDYTVRQPLAHLEDYKNVAIDKEGYLFPFTPFFTPKNLPKIYLGLASFGAAASDGDLQAGNWSEPLKGKYIALALDILAVVTDSSVADLFSVKRIDVSNAFAESYGTREIVMVTEDYITQKTQEKELQIHIPRILRLTTKNYAQELGNYLKLREQLLQDEKKKISALQSVESSICLKEKIIDFRVDKLAFIENN